METMADEARDLWSKRRGKDPEAKWREFVQKHMTSKRNGFIRFEDGSRFSLDYPEKDESWFKSLAYSSRTKSRKRS